MYLYLKSHTIKGEIRMTFFYNLVSASIGKPFLNKRSPPVDCLSANCMIMGGRDFVVVSVKASSYVSGSILGGWIN